MGRVRAAVGRCDRILMLPWGALPLVADGIRTPNPWVQLHFQALIDGLEPPLLPPGLVPPLPAAVIEPQARVRWARHMAGEPEPSDPLRFSGHWRGPSAPTGGASMHAPWVRT